MRGRKISVICILLAGLLGGQGLSAGLQSLLEPVVLVEEQVEEKAPLSSDTEVYEHKQEGATAHKPAKKEEAKPAYRITHEELQNALTEELADRFDLNGDFKLTLLKQFRDIELGEFPEWHVSDVILPSSGLRPNFTLVFEISHNGKPLNKFKSPVRCEYYDYALIAKDNYPNGAQLSHDFFTRQKIDILRVRKPLVEVVVDLDTYELKHAITKGRPLSWDQIESRPLVHKGDILMLTATEGGMHITTQGVALESGSQEDFISVRNTHSKQNIQAQIVDDKTAIVHF